MPSELSTITLSPRIQARSGWPGEAGGQVRSHRRLGRGRGGGRDVHRGGGGLRGPDGADQHHRRGGQDPDRGEAHHRDVEATVPAGPVGPAQGPFDQVVARTREGHHRPEAGGQQRPPGPPDAVRGHEHDHRPVPQVQAVGDEPDPADRAERQHPATTPVRGADGAHHDQGGAGGDGHGPPSQIQAGGPPAVAAPTTSPEDPEHGQRRPPGGAAREPSPPVGGQSMAAGPADQQLPGPGVGAQVGPVGPEQVGGHAHPHRRGQPRPGWGRAARPGDGRPPRPRRPR